MSVDREYTIRISTVTENSGTQQITQGLKDVGSAAEQAAGSTEALNRHGQELHELIREIERVAPGAGPTLQAILNPTVTGADGIPPVFERVKRTTGLPAKAIEGTSGNEAGAGTGEDDARADESSRLETAENTPLGHESAAKSQAAFDAGNDAGGPDKNGATSVDGNAVNILQ